MRRREAALARKEQRPQKKLFQTDYLLGIYDGHRMGALRFKTEMDGSFLNNNKESAASPWAFIRELEEISLKPEEDDFINDPEYLNRLSMLVAPGSSLGGSRPKANVVDPDGQLWIAKFPSRNDEFDIGGGEMVTCELALAAGIKMAESGAEKFSGKHHTFLTKRFDRTPKGERIHFAPAMTMLGYMGGQDHQAGVSYLELVEFIMKQGGQAASDLEQLWRRIVFSICVSNTDDHLRNHGFILTPGGWVLSPAYDINPVETGSGLSLNVSQEDHTLSLELAMEVHEYFRLSKGRALQIMDEVKNAVQNWRTVAGKFGISKVEQELKAIAFSEAES